MIMLQSAVEHKNPYILEMKEDVLYHLGLGTGTHNLPEMFGDIKVRSFLPCVALLSHKRDVNDVT